MTQSDGNPQAADSKPADRKELTRGAALSFLGRVGALIEAASFPLFLWLYGPVMFGVYATLWAIVRIGTGFTQMGMDVALQRFVPTLLDETAVHRSLGMAILVSSGAGVAAAVAIVAVAPWLAGFVDGDLGGSADLVSVIRVYAWTLPLWTAVEILTAAVRARRKFGPEIRIRTFYEQLLRIAFAGGFAWLGVETYGLFLAHLLSMGAASLLSLRLLARFYDLGRMMRAGLDTALGMRMIHYALPMMPTTLIQRFFSELPVVLLNALIPGATGATAAGFYSIARKISSVLMVVYNSFDYVIAPIAAYRAGRTGIDGVADMYAYSARLMIAVGLVLAAGVIGARHILLAALGPETAPAAAALAILVLGRLVTFFFGQAPAMMRTLASSYWSLANGLLGLAVMTGLLVILVEPFGTVGAAVAAACGLVLTRGLACIELAVLFKMSPYSRDLLRPLAVSSGAAVALYWIAGVTASWAAGLQLTVLVTGVLLSFALVLRYGLSREDAAAFGMLGRLLHPAL